MFSVALLLALSADPVCAECQRLAMLAPPAKVTPTVAEPPLAKPLPVGPKCAPAACKPACVSVCKTRTVCRTRVLHLRRSR